MSEVDGGRWEMTKIMGSKWLGLISKNISCLTPLFWLA